MPGEGDVMYMDWGHADEGVTVRQILPSSGYSLQSLHSSPVGRLMSKTCQFVVVRFDTTEECQNAQQRKFDENLHVK